MAKKVSKTLIGGFVVGAVALIVAGVIVFGSGEFLKQKNYYELHFEGTLKGLNVGSPVLLRGVKIGKVTDINIQTNMEDLTVQIPVIIEVNPDNFAVVHGKREMDPAKNLPTLIELGLRAQLQLQSFVTGQLMVEIDFYPNTPVRLASYGTQYPEIPTIPTTLERLSKTLEHLNIELLFNKVLSAVDGIDKTVNAPELIEVIRALKLAVEDARKLLQDTDEQVQDVGASADRTLKDYGKLARNVDSQVKPVLSNVNKAVKDYGKLARDLDRQTDPLISGMEEAMKEAILALEQARKTLAAAEEDLSQDSPTMYELNNALREISAMSRSIRQLADYLKRHPEALLSGKGEGGGK